MGTTYTTLRLYLFVVICRPHCFLFLCVTGTGNHTDNFLFLFRSGGFEPTKDMCLKVKKGNLKYLPILERILTTHRYVGQTVAMSYADVLAFEQLEQLVEGKQFWAKPFFSVSV